MSVNNNHNNRAVLLSQRPQGEVQLYDFAFKEYPIRVPSAGEIVVKVLWLSLDPYMRSRMNTTHEKVMELYKPVVGETVAEVVETYTDEYAVGDKVLCFAGWQEYATVNAKAVRKIEDFRIPPQAYLGVAGMPGRTGYCGMKYVGKPIEGETVVVSAAAGAVGSVAGQTAKKLGCRVVGIAGCDRKCNYVVDELGFDACLNYNSGVLDAELDIACPNGIDVYFDNVGGSVSRSVAPLLNLGARVPIAGTISTYNTESAEDPVAMFKAINNDIECRKFVVSEWKDERQEITDLLVSQVAAGELKYRETTVVGLVNAPAAFICLFKGVNFGKMLVQVDKGL